MDPILIDNQYQLKSIIKQGGFGTIYYGWDQVLSRPVAVKEILPHLVDDPHYSDMLYDEAVTVARLQHAGIAQIYDLRTSSERNLYIIMEYIDGLDLKSLLSGSGGPLAGELALHIASQVGEALHYAHTRIDEQSGRPLGIVHRDVSPSNLMLSREGMVKLIDFGIAKKALRRQGVTRTGVLKGTLSYMAPEQLLGSDLVDGRSDIFSLGVVLFEMVTGEQLFKETTSEYALMKTIEEVKVDWRVLFKKHTISKSLQDVLTTSLERDPDKRYQSAQEMQIACHELLKGASPIELKDRIGSLVLAQIVKAIPAEESPAGEATQTLVRNIATRTLIKGDGIFKPRQPALKKKKDLTPKQQLLIGGVVALATLFILADTVFNWPGIWQAIRGGSRPAGLRESEETAETAGEALALCRSITITSVPGEGEIVLTGNDSVLGYTDQPTTFLYGTHHLEIRAKGYRPYTLALKVHSASPERLGPFLLEEETKGTVASRSGQRQEAAGRGAPAAGQPAAVKGEVVINLKDSNYNPLRDIAVYYHEAGLKAKKTLGTTNQDGVLITSMAPGSYDLLVIEKGYQPFRTTIHHGSGKSQFMFVLYPEE